MLVAVIGVIDICSYCLCPFCWLFLFYVGIVIFDVIVVVFPFIVVFVGIVIVVVVVGGVVALVVSYLFLWFLLMWQSPDPRHVYPICFLKNAANLRLCRAKFSFFCQAT